MITGTWEPYRSNVFETPSARLFVSFSVKINPESDSRATRQRPPSISFLWTDQLLDFVVVVLSVLVVLPPGLQSFEVVIC
jgi:hypothetical protein